MTATPTASPRLVETAIREGDVDKIDMLLDLLIAQKVGNLHAAEISDSEFDEGDVELP